MKPFLRLLLIPLLSTLCHADASSKDIQRGLEKALLHKVMTVRGFYHDDSLTFSSDGKLLSAGTPGFGSSGGEIEVDQVQVKENRLVFVGTMPVLFFDQEKKSIRYVTGVGQRTVQVELSHPLASLDEAGQVLFKVFYAPSERVGNCPADEARRYQGILDDSAHKDGEPDVKILLSTKICGVGDEKLFRVGGGVKPPRAVYAPDPGYPEYARKKKLQGTVTLRVIVTEEGRAESILVWRSLGNGFDELAAAAIRTWKFEPATFEDKPVPVIVNVEVNFRLYDRNSPHP